MNSIIESDANSTSANARAAEVGGIVLSSQDVTKEFAIFDEGSAWRVVLGNVKNMRTVTALDGITLRVPKGEFVGILGRNGAGKSTLLRTLAGVHEPSTGSIEINGSVSALFELGGMGNRFLTGRAYARRILELQDTPSEEIPGLIEDVRRFSELGERFDNWILSYSSGMAARLYFAAATARPRDIYLLDEVLSVGDEHFQAKCWGRLRERIDSGASGILVTHDWSAILRLCREAHIVEHGRIVESGHADRVVQSYLRLAAPEPGKARFSALNPARYQARSNEDAVLPFEIEILELGEVALGYSLEMFRLGAGWEILLLENRISLPSTPGRYRVSLTLPRLPLSAGDYLLNLFLTSSASSATGFKIYDVRGWAHGNAIKLVVQGASLACPANLPATWKVAPT